MGHCSECGRWLSSTWTYKCYEEGIITEDGIICGCCREEMRKRGKGGVDDGMG